MEADWAEGGIGLKVGGFVPEKQPSRHGGSGDAKNKEAQPQQQARRAPKKPSSELAEWAGPGESLGGAGGGAGQRNRESSFSWSLLGE